MKMTVAVNLTNCPMQKYLTPLNQRDANTQRPY
jgi:hypothetical protein